MKPNIGISDKKLSAVTELLSVVLANQVTLYTKTRKFHWNVSGDSFMELHKLFESQYKLIEESIDLVAERISKLGSATIGTMSEFSKLTSIKEHPNTVSDKLRRVYGNYFVIRFIFNNSDNKRIEFESLECAQTQFRKL